MTMCITDGRGVRRLAATAVLVFVSLVVLASATPARAAFGIASFDATLSTHQAGGHPDLTTTFAVNSTKAPGDIDVPEGRIRDLAVALPEGFVGDPAAVPQCAVPKAHQGACPIESQIGVAEIAFTIGTTFEFPPQRVGIYNVTPAAGHAAEFVFQVMGDPVHMISTVQPGERPRVTTRLTNISELLPLTSATISLWGVPADPSHDPDRWNAATFSFGATTTAPRSALLTNPTRCGDATTELRATAWDHPGSWSAASTSAIIGCDRLAFAPDVRVAADTARAGSPAGVTVDVAVPQHPSTDPLATAHLRRAEVRLPEGFTISPSAGTGLAGCAPSEIALTDPGDATCPAVSRIGTTQIHTPLLHEPLEGAVFLARQGDNPFGSTLALYLEARGDGAHVKLAGRVDVDPSTGRLTTTFDDAPQLPFSRLRLQLSGGPRAVLTAPASCGTFATTATFAAHADVPDVVATDALTITDGCAQRGFSPRLVAGSTNAVAGADTPFSLTFSREDADEELGTIGIDLPRGLLGRIASVTPCDGAAAAAGSCGDASRIGTARVLAGPGADPLALGGGRVHLTGPYKGGPFGLSIVVPAVAGPLDLGTVVVRAAIHVDPVTTALRIVSDPLPTMLSGIPLRLRAVTVDVDRPGFMFNPTSCAPSAVAAAITSTGGRTAQASTRFQASDCGSLAFRPDLQLALEGAREARAGGHPAIVARVRPRAGDANLRRVQVVLPASLGFDLKSAPAPCEAAVAARGGCPESSIVGEARALSILHEPLVGPVHFVTGTGGGTAALPRLVATLRGEGVTVVLTAATDIVGGRVVTTFDDLPDVPLSAFDLRIAGGAKGLLRVGKGGLCTATQWTGARLDGQNGKRADHELVASVPCGLRVVARGWTRSRVTVRVSGVRRGTLRVTGAGVRRATRAVGRDAVVSVPVTLSAATRRAVAASGSARLALKIRFAPRHGKARTIRTSVRVTRVARGLAPAPATFG